MKNKRNDRVIKQRLSHETRLEYHNYGMQAGDQIAPGVIRNVSAFKTARRSVTYVPRGYAIGYAGSVRGKSSPLDSIHYEVTTPKQIELITVTFRHVNFRHYSEQGNLMIEIADALSHGVGNNRSWRRYHKSFNSNKPRNDKTDFTTERDCLFYFTKLLKGRAIVSVDKTPHVRSFCVGKDYELNKHIRETYVTIYHDDNVVITNDDVDEGLDKVIYKCLNEHRYNDITKLVEGNLT